MFLRFSKTFAKWSAAVLALTLVVGCSSLNKPSNQNNLAGNQSQTANNTSDLSDASAVQLVPISVSASFTNVTAFRVPECWTERKVGAGDAGGYVWTNPNDPTQEIDAIESGNVGALMGESTGKWNITGIFGQPDIQWSNISSNGETGSFTNTSKIIPFSASGSSTKTQYTGYGKAFIITKPEPYSFYIEVWGSQRLANAVFSTVQIEEDSAAAQVQAVALQNIKTDDSGMVIYLDNGYGSLESQYKEPQISDGKFAITLLNIDPGKYQLNKATAINSKWSTSMTITKSDNNLNLTFQLKPGLKHYNIGISHDEIEISFQ